MNNATSPQFGRFKPAPRVGRPNKHTMLMRMLDDIMDEHGLTKTGLARRIGMCRTMLWKIEREESPPGWEFIGRMHLAFGIPLEDLTPYLAKKRPAVGNRSMKK